MWAAKRLDQLSLLMPLLAQAFQHLCDRKG